ncbi:hypothetical protein D9758_012760 [Tetrapyrgos nigripes]|uniref:Uncharacterized protein n=1 Tax=Tetrapyrgos nigripes TaxID=182062 RepID=A0A8H5CRB3_9AGAR|nr:hypothetical protein D9758_012760 [Tetrapyrgos nigripes]
MFTKQAFVLLSALALAVSASPFIRRAELCAGQATVTESFIGKNKDVKLEEISCASGLSARALEGRQTNTSNVCGANCVTNCFTPSGGGPDPNECHIIADALRFESQNTSALFQIANGVRTAGANVVTLTFRSCESFFVNQDLQPLVYCRTDFADVIDFVAPNCQATQNAHGGNCVATDQRWFIQVQHS